MYDELDGYEPQESMHCGSKKHHYFHIFYSNTAMSDILCFGYEPTRYSKAEPDEIFDWDDYIEELNDE